MKLIINTFLHMPESFEARPPREERIERNPALFFAQQLARHLPTVFKDFEQGKIDREAAHRQVRSGVEAALQGIEAFQREAADR